MSPTRSPFFIRDCALGDAAISDGVCASLSAVYRRAQAPQPVAADRHPQSSCERNGGSAPSASLADAARLSALDRQALLVGLDDALHRRRIIHPDTRGGWRAFLRQMFGTGGVPPLANPRLEALRMLAMRDSGGQNAFHWRDEAYHLPPELIAEARRFLAKSGQASEDD